MTSPQAGFQLASWGTVVRELYAHTTKLPGARARIAFSAVLLMCGAGSNILVPTLLGRIVDVVSQGAEGATATIWMLAGLLVAAAIFSASLNALGFYLVSRETEKIINSLRYTMISTALTLPVHHVEEAGTGDLISRSTDDINTVSEAVSQTLPSITQSVFMVGATTVALASMDWHFILIPLIALPFYASGIRRYLAVAPNRYAAERASVASLARRVLETIHGLPTVHAYRWEEQITDEIRQDSSDVVRHGLYARTSMFAVQAVVTFCEYLMLTTAVITGYVLVSRGAVTVGVVTSAVFMLVRLRGPILGLMRQLDVVQSAYASLARVVGVLQEVPAEQPERPAVPAPAGRAQLSHVTFRYPGSQWGIADLNLELEPRKTVALVGASGAGKSTVAALLAGLRRADSGEILIDGVSIDELSDAQRASRLALITQEIHVFSGTLREDLSLAKEGATDEELIAALRTVHADWWKELPRGLDTEVGHKGQQLSPMQAQQLALARVLLIDPSIVILDEATAEAGSTEAGDLEEAAAAVVAGRTALIVAHRLDQAATADRVVVMDNGRITEVGTHAELLRAGGAYATMWQAWSTNRTAHRTR